MDVRRSAEGQHDGALCDQEMVQEGGFHHSVVYGVHPSVRKWQLNGGKLLCVCVCALGGNPPAEWDALCR